LSSVRSKLERHLLTCPLFDTDRFRRHIEAAYVTMWERSQSGEAPRRFRVEPIGGSVKPLDSVPQRAHEPESLTNLAAALAELKRHDEAVACYDKALAIDPECVAALLGRAHALRRLSRSDEAIA